MASTYYLYPTTNFENEGGNYSSYGTNSINDTFGAWDDDTGGWLRTDLGSGIMKRFTWNMTDFLPIASGIQSVTIGFRLRNVNGGWADGEHVVRMGGVNYVSGFVFGSTGGVYTNFENVWTTNPNTAAAWTVADLNALIAGCGVDSRAGTKEYRITGIYATVLYTGAPTLAPQARDVASRRVFDLGSSKALLTQRLPLETAMLVNVMDDLPVVHWAGPHDSAGGGWRPKLWEARLTKVYSVTIDPNTSGVEVELRDRRPALCLMQDTGWSLKSSSAEAIGIARIDKGCTRTHTRTGDGYVLAPGGLRLTKVLENAEMYGSVGQMHQRGDVSIRTVQNGFKNGAADTYTGWTKAVNGTGASIVDELEDSIWEPFSTGVQRSVKITQGNPLGVNSNRLDSTVIGSLVANTLFRVSGWCKDLTPSVGAWWKVERTIDAFSWRESDATWVAAATYNQVPYSADWHRFKSKQINIGGTATTLQLSVGGGGTASATPATVGQVNLWSHIQIEHYITDPTGQPSFVSGEHLNDTTGTTRLASKLTISNNAAARCWNAPQGAFVCEVIPQWSSAELGNINATIAWISFDASNWVWYYYDGTNDRWVAEIRAGGTTYRAVKSATLVAGTVYLFGARHTGSNGELDLSPFTLSVFVDKAKGTDVVMAAATTETSTSDLEIGSKAALEHFNGVVRLAHSYQFCPTDNEMARLPA